MSGRKRIVLAYSGGLDTSVAIPWLRERYDAEVVALTVDVGQERDLEEVRQKALRTGAVKAVVVDGKQEFLEEFVWPAFQAGALYQGQYPLATALARPLIARHLVRVALEEEAFAVAHGCTGKGNDQVRFEVSIRALAPHLQVIAPARVWGMSREEEIEYARARGVPVPVTKESPFSIDENLWGRSIEAGPLEDPWQEPPENAFAWTRPIAETPDEPLYLEIEFEGGIPIALNGERLDGVSLVRHLNRVGGEHGVGRIDHIEDRLVGIKSREVYEAPAGVILHTARSALEGMVLSKDQRRFKERVAQEFAELVYNGLWFSAHREDLTAYIRSTQRFVTGTVRVRLHKGTCTAVGRRSPYSLYRYELATYDRADRFDQRASEGFIYVFGLPTVVQAEVQGRRSGEG